MRKKCVVKNMKRKFRKAQTAFKRVDNDLHLILVHHTRQTTLNCLIEQRYVTAVENAKNAEFRK